MSDQKNFRTLWGWELSRSDEFCLDRDGNPELWDKDVTRVRERVQITQLPIVHGSRQFRPSPQSLWQPKPRLVVSGWTPIQRLPRLRSRPPCSDQGGNEWATWSPSQRQEQRARAVRNQPPFTRPPPGPLVARDIYLQLSQHWVGFWRERGNACL